MEKESALSGRLNAKAFTLIELLVVVLIIGILAAVAVPEYQLAVRKSKYTKLKIYSNALYDAVQRYYLANGSWPTQTDDLDVDLPGQHYWGNYIYLPDGGSCYIWYDGNGRNGYVGCTNAGLTYMHNFQENNNRYCRCSASNALNKKICLQETQDTSPYPVNGMLDYKYP